MKYTRDLEEDLSLILRDASASLGVRLVGKTIAEALMNAQTPEGTAEEVYRRLAFLVKKEKSKS